MRGAPTYAERLMWEHLKGKRLGGHKFRRQMPIDEFIVDFVCSASKLVVELDGEQHAENGSYDEFRSLVIGRHGYRVLRFWNREVFEDLEGVMAVIRAELAGCRFHLRRSSPCPLLKEGVKMAGAPDGGGESGGWASPAYAALRVPLRFAKGRGRFPPAPPLGHPVPLTLTLSHGGERGCSLVLADGVVRDVVEVDVFA